MLHVAVIYQMTIPNLLTFVKSLKISKSGGKCAINCALEIIKLKISKKLLENICASVFFLVNPLLKK